MNNTDVNFNSYILLPSIDALQEFKIQSGMYSAEFGRGIGQVNVITKSGTNTLHGTAWEFVRNNNLDALPYALRHRHTEVEPVQVEPVRVHAQWSGRDSPLIDGRNKLFFMGNYEGFQLRNQRDTLYSVPSAAMRRGDFSELSAAIRDPLTGAPFPGNIIPASRLDPISVNMLDYYPLPNQPTSASSEQLSRGEQRLDRQEPD